jgi:transposase-like protein
MTDAILILAAIAIVIILYISVKAFKSPTLFFATEESVDDLATKLSCPKCRSRRLKPTGRYTIGCENCGFTFSVGTVAKRPSSSS